MKTHKYTKNSDKRRIRLNRKKNSHFPGETKKPSPSVFICYYAYWSEMNQREIIEIVGSWLAVSVAFAWVMQDPTSGQTIAARFLPSLLIALVAVGTGFIFHELAHKYVAIHYGAHAEFFAWPFGLGLALLLAFTIGIVFAAPGAVYIFATNLSKKQNGIISLCGPIVNIVLGILFVIAGFLLLPSANSFWSTVGFQAGVINFWLAFFNLIPLGPLDGKKVFDWNKLVWAAFFVPLVLVFLFVRVGF